MMAQDSSVPELSASLVREYLARKGLKRTLAKLDEEMPRTSESISNRTSLAKAVNIDKLMKKNKDEATPYRTMIEVIVKHLTTTDRSTFSHSTTPSRTSTRYERGVTDSTHVDGDRLGASSAKGQASSGDDSGKCRSPERNPEPLMRTGYQHGKPITSKSSHPPTREISSMPPSLIASTPPQSSTWRDDSTSKDKMEKNRTPSSRLERDKVKVVEVKPRAARTVPPGGSMVTSSWTTSSSSKMKSRSYEGGGKIPKSLTTSKHGEKVKVMCSEEVMSTGGEVIADVTRMPLEFDPALTLGHRVDVTATACQEFSRRDIEGETAASEAKCEGAQLKTIKDPVASKTDDLLLFEDLEDFDVGGTLTPSSPLPSALKPLKCKGEPIDLSTAKALRELVFGTAVGRSFNDEWRKQNFEFCDLPGLKYGLVQHKGGPCGVLACVQAYVLKHLIYSASGNSSGSLDPSPSERRSSLVAALADILWKAGRQKSATVALSVGRPTTSSRIISSSQYKPDGLTERLLLYQLSTSSELRHFIEQHLPVLQDPSSNGCILFFYSLLLSRGIESVRADMDADTTLLGAHGYCTQEIVNLMLTGCAVSNMFNGVQYLDTGGKEKHMLRGPPQRSEIGLLSLFEHYGVCSVGTYLKDPVYPIWVISSESHFTVLFCPQRQGKSENKDLGKTFDLHYYDGLANQDDAIVLTIDNSRTGGSTLSSISDLEPPLELVVKTKWRIANIDWNGTEPLL